MTLEEKLDEMHRLLIEAYDHYFATSDGHCKSSEGVVTLDYPTYWELKDGIREPRVSVYSYVLGPSRTHSFANIDHALSTVKRWHANEMVATHEVDWDSEDGDA